MASRFDQRLAGALAIVALTCLVASMAGAGTVLLHLAPAVVLFAVLAARRYPGERRLLRLVTRWRARRVRPRRIGAPTTPLRRRVTGGLLLAEARAERGPPAPALSA